MMEIENDLDFEYVDYICNFITYFIINNHEMIRIIQHDSEKIEDQKYV